MLSGVDNDAITPGDATAAFYNYEISCPSGSTGDYFGLSAFH